jgi:hypothetical protein
VLKARWEDAQAKVYRLTAALDPTVERDMSASLEIAERQAADALRDFLLQPASHPRWIVEKSTILTDLLGSMVVDSATAALAADCIRTDLEAMCPVAPSPEGHCLAGTLKQELDGLTLALRDDEGPGNAAWDRKSEIEDDLATIRAVTIDGATMQIALAMGLIDLVATADEDDTRGLQQADRLLSSALNVILGERLPSPGVELYAGTYIHRVCEMRDASTGAIDPFALLAEYRALGGDFTLHRKEGSAWLGQKFALEPTGRTDEIERAVWGTPWIRAAIIDALDREPFIAMATARRDG